jgi:Zn-dependent peptidase ImmA (M78 family)
MQTTVDISPEILNWVIAHVHSDAVPTFVTDYIEQWKTGEKKPTFNQVEKVGRATGIPLGYFFLHQPPKEDLSLLDYRTIDSLDIQNPSRNLVDTIHDMERIQDWMRDYLLADNAPELQFVGSQRDTSDIGKFADSMRKALGINEKWFEQCDSAEDSFRYIRLRISNLGVIVMMSGIVENNTHRALSINEFRAFALVDKYAPLIFINANDSTNGRLFSLLHELAHIWIGKNDFFNDRYSATTKAGTVETICNTVAAEILVPRAVFLTMWETVPTGTIDEQITYLARYFKCGHTVIARKALDYGRIDDAQYKKIAQLAVTLFDEAQKKKKEQGLGGGDYYNTAASRIDHRFFHALLGSLHEGKTLYSDAFRLTNTNRTTFMTLAEKVRGGEQ